jgi:putative SOS response-associated peptidase YedK
MCGRYTITVAPDKLAEHFGASLPQIDLVPRYNVAPTQDLPVLINEGDRAIQMLHWGLIPRWAKEASIGNNLINARAETLQEKPAFRDAFKKRRCLVLADGFYEWKRTDEGKIPMRITLQSGEPFAFAGLWEFWKPADAPKEDPWLRSFTIITTTPNELMETIHNRMPVILSPEAQKLWLDNEAGADDWYSVLRPYDANDMRAYPVSKRVNSPAFDDHSLIEPMM